MRAFDTSAWELLDGAEAVVVSKTHPIAAVGGSGWIDVINTHTGESLGYVSESDYAGDTPRQRAATRLAEAEVEMDEEGDQ